MEVLANILDRSSLGQAVIKDLRYKIVFHHYANGDLLSEADLANQYGVSRNIIRQVLQILINESLIIALPNGRKQVIGFSLEYINQHYDVREALECTAASTLVKSNKINYNAIANGFSALNEIKALDQDSFLKIRNANNGTIHCSLIEASSNPLLLRQYMILSPMIEMISAFNSNSEIDIEANKDIYISRHALLLEAAISKNPNYEDIIRSHLEDARNTSIFHVKTLFDI